MNLKWNIRFILAAGLMAGTTLARAEHVASVIGVVNLTNYQAALLVITDSPPDASFANTTHIWVTQGHRFDDLNLLDNRVHIEIREIDFTNGVVHAKEGGVNTLYLPQPTNLMGTAAGTGLHLNNVGFDDALDLYAATKNRTLLVHPDVKHPSVTVSADARTKAEVAGLMKKPCGNGRCHGCGRRQVRMDRSCRSHQYCSACRAAGPIAPQGNNRQPTP